MPLPPLILDPAKAGTDRSADRIVAGMDPGLRLTFAGMAMKLLTGTVADCNSITAVRPPRWPPAQSFAI